VIFLNPGESGKPKLNVLACRANTFTGSRLHGQMKQEIAIHAAGLIVQRSGPTRCWNFIHFAEVQQLKLENKLLIAAACTVFPATANSFHRWL
jgi:hypothetical protein